MTIEELKAAIIAIDAKLDSDDISDEEFDALEEEARTLTAKLGGMESAADLRILEAHCSTSTPESSRNLNLNVLSMKTSRE